MLVPEQEAKTGEVESPVQELAVLPLRNTVVFPLTVLPLIVERPRSIRLVDDAVVADRLITLVALKNPEVDEPEPSDLYGMGTVAIIHRMARTPDGARLHLVVQGVERVRIKEIIQTEPYFRAEVEKAPEVIEEGVEMEALMRLHSVLQEHLDLVDSQNENLWL